MEYPKSNVAQRAWLEKIRRKNIFRTYILHQIQKIKYQNIKCFANVKVTRIDEP